MKIRQWLNSRKNKNKQEGKYNNNTQFGLVMNYICMYIYIVTIRKIDKGFKLNYHVTVLVRWGEEKKWIIRVKCYFIIVRINPCMLNPVQLCDTVDCSPPGSSAHGISQARILERAAISPPQEFLTQGFSSSLLRHLHWQEDSASATWEAMLLFSCSVVSDSFQPHGLQHARLRCPSLSPGVIDIYRKC